MGALKLTELFNAAEDAASICKMFGLESSDWPMSLRTATSLLRFDGEDSGVIVRVSIAPEKNIERIRAKLFEKGAVEESKDILRCLFEFADPYVLSLFYQC